MQQVNEVFTIVVEVGGDTESTYLLYGVVDVPCLQPLDVEGYKHFRLDVDKIKWVFSSVIDEKTSYFSEVIDCSKSTLYAYQIDSPEKVISLRGNWKLMLTRELKPVIHDLMLIGRCAHYELRIIKA